MASLLDSCNALRKNGKIEEAFELAFEIERNSSKNMDTLTLCQINMELGVLYGRVGEIAESTSRFRNQLNFGLAVGEKRFVSRALNNLGGNFLIEEDYDSALFYLQKAKEKKWEIGDYQGYASTCVNLSMAYRSLGQEQKAFDQYQESLSYLIDQEDKKPYYTSVVNFAALYVDLGEYSTADSLLRLVLRESDGLNYRIQYLQALEAFSVVRYNLDEFKEAYDSLESFNQKQAAYIGGKTRARIQELEIKHAKAEKQIEVDRAELLAEKRKTNMLILLVGLILAIVGGLLWVMKVRRKSRERTRILNQSFEKETKRITDLVWHEVALSVEGKNSSLASGKEMSKEALFGAMGVLEYLKNQQKNPFLQVGLNRALKDMFVPREGSAVQVTYQLDEVQVDKKFRVTVFRILEALFNNCLDSIRSGELRIKMRVDGKKIEVEFDVPGELLEKSALYLAAGARLHELKGKMKVRQGNAGMLLEVTIPLPRAT